MMLMHESHLFKLRIETKFEVSDPRNFFYACISANDTTRQAFLKKKKAHRIPHTCTGMM